MKGLPTCQDVQAAMTDYMEGALPFRKRLGIRIHLMMCDLCSGLHQRLLALPRMAKDLLKPPAEPPPPEALGALDRALEAIQKERTPDR